MNQSRITKSYPLAGYLLNDGVFLCFDVQQGQSRMTAAGFAFELRLLTHSRIAPEFRMNGFLAGREKGVAVNVHNRAWPGGKTENLLRHKTF